jgi:hypothetical protein
MKYLSPPWGVWGRKMRGLSLVSLGFSFVAEADKISNLDLIRDKACILQDLLSVFLANILPVNIEE